MTKSGETTPRRFGDVEDNIFCRITSPGSPYHSKFLIAIPDDQLPHCLRHHDEESTVFLVSHISVTNGHPIEIVVRAMLDIPDTMPVTIESPLPPDIPNGAYVVLVHDGPITKDYEPVRIVQIGRDGTVKTKWTHRGPGRNRKKETAHAES